MIKIIGLILTIALLTGCGVESGSQTSQYNIVWDSPSKDHHGSMPVGNGSIGLNVWVEDKGDLCLYIGRTDAWSDNGRLLKIGKVCVTCDPPIVYPGVDFKQELDLATGTIRIYSNGSSGGRNVQINLAVWVDAHHPVVTISQESSVPLQMTARIDLWRKAPYALPALNVSDLLEDRSKPGNLHEPVIVEPDIVISGRDRQIGWYHHNSKSVGFDLTNQLQGLSGFFKQDPLIDRTFGTLISASSPAKMNDTTLVTGRALEGHLSLVVHTKHPSTPREWLHEVSDLMQEAEASSLPDRLRAHEIWWRDFWQRSWIRARQAGPKIPDTQDDAFVVSRAYALQRYMEACAGRGHYPIKFNGSIFTVPYADMPGNADYRRWGPGYWWQNTRLPYLGMCTAGDYDLIQPLFQMYGGEIFKTSTYRTKKYFGIDGAYFPECMYFWGAVFTATYGWEPYELRTDKLQVGGWHKREWVAGPELVFMMFDYYDYTDDTRFLSRKLIPVANAVIRFFDQYYKTDDTGTLVMHPSQALETWWDCKNPMPEIAGLTAICQRLLQLPQDKTASEDRTYWKKFLAKLPELPVRDTPSGIALAPAEQFADKRNVENPSLYAVFPFRLIGLGRPDLSLGLNALKHRWDKGSFGWRQDEIFMAYLGMTDQAKEYLVKRSKTFDQGSRFPAFWGPNYDWVPDQDHGGVLMKAFQSMLIQADPYSEKIFLFPAWPKEWDCEFRVHAPYKTVIEGRIKDGHLLDLRVTPAAREKDIMNMLR
jgi:alpha-L-fucosidase 2